MKGYNYQAPIFKNKIPIEKKYNFFSKTIFAELEKKIKKS